MSIDQSVLKTKVFESIHQVMTRKTNAVNAETILLGEGGVLNSLNLVELCLALEDLASEKGFYFDWTSESALSKTKSIFRTAGTLADEFISQSQKPA